jgi:hypothetical protein
MGVTVVVYGFGVLRFGLEAGDKLLLSNVMARMNKEI